MSKNVALLVLCALATAGAQQNPSPLRIGVFDSRAVAIAYARSPEFARYVEAMRNDLASAKAANDQARVQELERKGEWMQIRLHQQGFSTATVTGILEKVKNQLPAVAAQAGVTVLVSKWEVAFAGSGVQTVDVTDAIVALFHPSEQVLKIVAEMKNHQPIAFDQLPLDPHM